MYSLESNKNDALICIKTAIEKVKKINNDVAIIVVANVNPHDSNEDRYKMHSFITEFYAENEYEQIISAFRENGFYVTLFRNESEFIKWFIGNGLGEIHKKHIAVYNAAIGGRGPGKKALIPAFCNLNNLAITSSNPYVVSLCRHKYHLNAILKNHGLPVAESWYYHKDYKWLMNQKPENGTTIIAKPSYESASIGIDENSVFIYNEHSDSKLDKLTEKFNQPITVQKFISGYEIEVPIIITNGRPIAIKPIGLSVKNIKYLDLQILTYDTVYNDGYDFYEFEELGTELNKKILEVAKNATLLIGIEGFGRIDFRITKDGQYHIIDIATNPHIIHHSSFWYLFKSLGLKYNDVLALLVGLTAEKYQWY